jgi:hypothetical protein
MLSKQINQNINSQNNIKLQNKFYNVVNPVLQTNKTIYSLDQHCFDPNQHSPPNNFLLKIHQRIKNS